MSHHDGNVSAKRLADRRYRRSRRKLGPVRLAKANAKKGKEG